MLDAQVLKIHRGTCL